MLDRHSEQPPCRGGLPGIQQLKNFWIPVFAGMILEAHRILTNFRCTRLPDDHAGRPSQLGGLPVLPESHQTIALRLVQMAQGLIDNVYSDHLVPGTD